MTRPRAADDFTAIRARRIEELRRERAQVVDDDMDQTPSGPRLYYRRSTIDIEPYLPRPIGWRFLG